MRVGVPKEIKVEEYRVGMTPASAREYVARGYEVVVYLLLNRLGQHRPFLVAAKYYNDRSSTSAGRGVTRAQRWQPPVKRMCFTC